MQLERTNKSRRAPLRAHACLLACVLASAFAAGSALADCEQSAAAVKDKFKDVFAKTPEQACDYNNKAGWDKELAKNFQPKDARSCTSTPDGTVCQATYKRLRSAVTTYQDNLKEACEKGAAAKSCMDGAGGDQKAAYQCAAKAERDAAAASAKARQALADAQKEAAAYKDLTQKVKEKYAADKSVIEETKKKLEAEGTDPGALYVKMRDASYVQNQDFVASGGAPSIFTQLGGNGNYVDANNGVANSNISRYADSVERLVAEQDTAARTIDSFNRAASSEISSRQSAEASLTADAAKNERLAAGGGALPSSGDTKGSTISGSAAKDSSTGSNVGNLASLASAGTGLAGAAKAAGAAGGTGASSLPGGITAAYPTGGGGTAPSPSSPNFSESGVGRKFGDASPSAPGGVAPLPKAPDVPNAPDSPQPGPATAGRGGSVPGLSGTGPVAIEAGGTRASTPAVRTGASRAPGDSSGASLKDGRTVASAKEEKGCGGADCAAINELKSEQFSAGGPLGIPKIGVDPGLSTTGALDNIFGTLPGLDPLTGEKPSASLRSPGGLLESMLGGGTSEAGENGAGAAQASNEVAPANTKSLFARVHDVHENAVRKGSISLFHRKL